jgi:hypothetical protein
MPGSRQIDVGSSAAKEEIGSKPRVGRREFFDFLAHLIPQMGILGSACTFELMPSAASNPLDAALRHCDDGSSLFYGLNAPKN